MTHRRRTADTTPTATSTRTVRGGGSVALIAVMTVLAAACGGSGGGDAEVTLSEAGARGQSISRSNGCSGCHGTDGQGGVGPSWIDLYGSEVELDDGTTVIADEDYLARAISDPGAEKVEGASVVMPSNGLTDDEIADVIAYIRDLSPSAAAVEVPDTATGG